MLITNDSTLEEVWQVAWNYLKRAAVDKGHPMRYLTLGTLAGSEVGLRMVVLREIQENDSLLMYTDARSAKVDQLHLHPKASILTYHPRHKVQIRLLGNTSLHHRDALAHSHWEKVQGPPQKAYNSIMTPGSPINSPEQAHQWPKVMDERHFCVIQFQPMEIEVLQLNGLAHLRAEFKLKGEGWVKSWIVP